MRVEGNLTALLHGSEAAIRSLHADELGEAVGAFLGTAEQLIGDDVPEARAWEVHRLDPSKTVDAGGRSGELIDAAALAWGRLRNPRQTVARYHSHGESVRWQHAMWRSWEVYDKTAEAAARGVAAPAGLVRLEARIRPRKGSGDWKRAAPTLALDTETRRLVMGELESLGESVISRAAALGAGGVMLALVEAGVAPNTAVRLAGYLVVADELGPSFFDRLGIPAKTLERWRAEVRKALRTDEPDSEERLAAVFRTMAGDLLADDLPEVFARDIVASPSKTKRKGGKRGS